MAIYVRNSSKFKVLENLTCVVDNIFECVCIELHTFNRKATIISCIYRQPDDKIDDFIRKIEDFLRKQEIKYLWMWRFECKFIKLWSTY